MTLEGICGLGLNFTCDGFRALYGVIAAFMWAETLLFSVGYFKGHGNLKRYYIFTAMTFLAVEGLFFSADFYTAFVFFELMSLTSYVWVVQEETAEAKDAADTYLAVAVMGGLVMLMGLFLLYHEAGTLEFAGVRTAMRAAEDKTAYYAGGGCMLVGFGAKAGMFPLHIWLPKAHAAAPAPASALLSGILTKTGIFGILLVTVYMFADQALWGGWVLAVGLVTMTLGAVLALFSNQLKRTLACSSMSQIGFILVGTAMIVFLGPDNELAVRGTILHMVNHSLIKLVLFMTAGVVFMNLGELGLNEIRGFGRRKPFLLFCYLMGALGIAGVPGWNGYVSKTLLHESIAQMAEGALAAGMDAVPWKMTEALFLFAGGLTAAYMLKLFVVLFVERHPKRQQEYDRMSDGYISGGGLWALLLASVLLPVMGAFPGTVMDAIAFRGQGFISGREAFETVRYFSAKNLEGALLSLAVGLLVYAVAVGLWMRGRRSDGSVYYRNRWPWWLDLERFVYRPVFLTALPAVLGFLSRVMDHAVDACILLARKTTHRQTRERYKRLDGDRIAYLIGVAWDDVRLVLNRTVFRKAPRRESMIPRMVELEEMILKTGGIIGTSLSFSLMLVCIGLCLTLVYLIV